MKVLLIARSFTRGGAASGAANLALALGSVIPTVYRRDTDSLPTPGFLHFARRAERVIERVLFDAETHCLRLAPPSIDLISEVAQHQPDIVQLCDISASTIDPRAIARCPVPVVHRMSDFWPYHGPSHYGAGPETSSSLARKMFSFSGFNLSLNVSHARVAPSHWLADNTAGTPRPVVISNAVESPAGIMPRTGPRSPLRLGFIAGKIGDPRKGYGRLARALSDVRRPAELHSWGRRAGPVPGLPVPVTHHGMFARKEVSNILSDIDILLCPSRLDNSPNTATEALAHAVPVIGQQGTGITTYVDATRGALVDFDGPPQAIAEAIENVCRDYAGKSRAALGFARDTLSPERIGTAYLDLYETLLSGQRT